MDLVTKYVDLSLAIVLSCQLQEDLSRQLGQRTTTDLISRRIDIIKHRAVKLRSWRDTALRASSGYASASLASTASPSASSLRAARTCSSSTSLPSSTTSAEPLAAAASKAATTRRLCSSSAAEGAKTRLAAVRVFGWMSVFPSKPRARPCARAEAQLRVGPAAGGLQVWGGARGVWGG